MGDSFLAQEISPVELFAWASAAYDKLARPVILVANNYTQFFANQSAMRFFGYSSMEAFKSKFLAELSFNQPYDTIKSITCKSCTNSVRDGVCSHTVFMQSASNSSNQDGRREERSHGLRGTPYPELGPNSWVFVLAVEDCIQNSVAVSIDAHSVGEEIRVGLARELHDHLGQELTVLRLAVSKLQRELTTSKVPTEVWHQHLSFVQEQVEVVSQAGHHIAFDLRPDIVRSHGLAFAAGRRIITIRDRTGINGVLEVAANWVEPSSGMESHLYRSLQELLNNVVKHSRATKFKVKLFWEDEKCCMEIIDNGVGAPAERIQQPLPENIGLRSLRERAALFNGKVHIQSRPTIEGFRVLIELPERRNLKNQKK